MKILTKFPLHFLLAAFVLLLTACAGIQSAVPSPATPTQTESPTQTIIPRATPQAAATEILLAPAEADSPAAGICSYAPEKAVVSAEIFADIPSPRCLKVTPGQQLQVINRSDVAVQVQIGGLSASLQPGEQHTFETPFGDYLAPGVHTTLAKPYSGPEIWLVEN